MGSHDLKQKKHQSYMGEEAGSPTFWSLAELRYKNQFTISNLPIQHMILKVENQPARLVKVADVQDYSPDEEARRAVRDIIHAANPQYYMTEEEIVAEQEARRRTLEQQDDTEPDDYLDSDE